MTTTAAADGTSQRSAGLDLNMDTMSTSRFSAHQSAPRPL
jgi:hypothetical protein